MSNSNQERIQDKIESCQSCRSPSQPLSSDQTTTNRKERRKLANRARHRLLSIYMDFYTNVKPSLEKYPDIPIVCNERCGSWYAGPSRSGNNSCYFKSTDGHTGVWNLSLKRLNLNIINLVKESHCGSVIILDASNRKIMPDSFSRTIPMWAACMNRIAARYRMELGLPLSDPWDTNLYTPSDVVSQEEHDTMASLVDTRTSELYDSQAIVDPKSLAMTLDKPLRPYWITFQEEQQHHSLLDFDENSSYYRIICLNCSTHYQPSRTVWKDTFWYTPGAADDHESWARKLNPTLFWKNSELLLKVTKTDDETDRSIDELVQNERGQHELPSPSSHPKDLFQFLGDDTKLAVGSRRAGRPPECWNHFDAILNVSDLSYPDIINTMSNPQECYYLQLPVVEGKRSELEKWMAVGIAFCMIHAERGRRILIHCAQGKDRSVAIAMATIVLCCNLTYPLRWKCEFLQEMVARWLRPHGSSEHYKSSGLHESLVQDLVGWDGRDRLLQWVRQVKKVPHDHALASKETLRITLHLLKQDREHADPSRSTMQKLNRFFMSKSESYSKTK